MADSKPKFRARKGLLPPVAGAASKAKPTRQAHPASVLRGDAASPAPAKHATSTAQKPCKAAKIDKYTGKKKGTLFSAAPTSKSSATLHTKKEPVAESTPTKKSEEVHARPPTTERKHNQGTQAEACNEGGSKGSERVGPRKKRYRKKGDGNSTAAATAAAGVSVGDAGPPSNKGATGKSNWDRLKAQALKHSEGLPAKAQHPRSASHTGQKRKRASASQAQSSAKSSEWLAASSQGIVDGKLVAKSEDSSKTEVLALDCEMVGVGASQGRKRDALARATLINDAGNVLLDVWVRPKEKVTDYRFHVTGIRWADLKDGISLEEASRRMHELTTDCILVGHAVHNDIKVLALQGTIPRHRIRDTALYPPLMGVRKGSGKLYSRALRHVVSEELGISIQAGEHDPVQDARAALYLYHKHRQVWEMQVSTGLLHQPGVRTSAKLTKGFRKQKRMRIDKHSDISLGPKPLAADQPTADAAEGSDDEFALPDALAVARMKARMAGDVQADHLADL